MTRIIAILFMLGRFEVAVETSRGYFVATYPDTEIGVTQFLEAIRPALATETGRFYPCIGYEGPARDLLQSPLAQEIRVVEKLQTGRRDPGIADAPGSFATTESRPFLRVTLRRSWTPSSSRKCV